MRKEVMLKMKNFGETLKFEREETSGWQLVAFHCRESRNTVDSALNELGYNKYFEFLTFTLKPIFFAKILL